MDKVYPSIKGHEWVASGHDLYCKPLYTGPGSPEKSPVIGYGVDQGGSVGFLLKDTLPSSVMVDIRFYAQKNLEARLAQLQWKQDTHEKQWNFEGDYYASEGLLSRTVMNQAHEGLGTSRLAAATPRRGELVVLALDEAEQSEVEKFIDEVLQSYFVAKHSGTTEAVSPILWIFGVSVKTRQLAGDFRYTGKVALSRTINGKTAKAVPAWDSSTHHPTRHEHAGMFCIRGRFCGLRSLVG